jgi:hypothetical protein
MWLKWQTTSLASMRLSSQPPLPQIYKKRKRRKREQEGMSCYSILDGRPSFFLR